MSHIVSCKADVKDVNMLHNALESLKKEGKLDYEWMGQGTEQSYSRKTTGTHFKLSKWHYPVCVCDDGSIQFDNYNGHWGKPIDLDMVIQRYQELQIMRKARENGWQVEKVTASNGDVTLNLTR